MTKNIKLPNGLYIIIMLLFSSNLLLLTSKLTLRNIGKQTLFLSFLTIFGLIIYYYVIKRKMNLNMINLSLVIAIFLLIQLISMLINFDGNYELLTKVGLIFGFITLSAHLRWSKHHFILTGIFVSLAIGVLFLDWSLTDQTSSFRSVFRNPNGLAIVLFISIYYQWLSIKFTQSKLAKIYFLCISIVTVFLIVQTRSRAVLISLIVVIAVMVILHYKENLAKFLMPLITSLITIFMIVYIKVFQSPIGSYLNEISRKLFNKSLFSGRESLWIEIWEAIEQASFLGYGISKTSINITTLQLSTHNQYLQTLLETGLIGLIIFLVILIMLNQLLVNDLNKLESKLSFSFFIAIIVYSTFELTLFQNNFPVSLIQWTVITTGINLPKNRIACYPFSLSIKKTS